MTLTLDHGELDSPLIASLFDAFEASGREKAVLPDGRHDDVAHLLKRLMADPGRLDAYCSILEAERHRRGPEVEMRLLGMAGLDIPDALIANEGFQGLSDEQLADIALSPEAIEAVREYLDDPETHVGAWFFDAINAAESARPDADEQARHAAEIYRRLKEGGGIS